MLQPYLLVARKSDFTERDLPVAPLLAIEVLSPSTRRIDLTLKKSRFEAAGCPSYWVVDPEAPSLTAWQLRDGVYADMVTAGGEQTFAATEPFEVSLRPVELLDG